MGIPHLSAFFACLVTHNSSSKLKVFFLQQRNRLLTQSSSFSLRLQQGQNISLTNGSLNIANDGAMRGVQKLNPHLRNPSSGSSTPQDLSHTSQNDGLSLFLSLLVRLNKLYVSGKYNKKG